MRVGQGVDVHRLGGDGPLILLGVEVSADAGLIGTSDADAGAHAVADALLGAAAMGDMGDHFPSDDPQWVGADSMELLATVVGLLAEAGWAVANVDVTLLIQTVRIGPHRLAMRERLAEVLRIDAGRVSVKATTTAPLGLIGRAEGVAALATALIEPAG